MSKLFKINDKDNVAVALEELKKGEKAVITDVFEYSEHCKKKKKLD